MTEAKGRRLALLIGVGRYDAKDELAPLPTATNDVKGLAKLLRDSERCRFTDVREVFDVDSQGIRESLSRVFNAAERDDLVLVYFSGHGKLGETGHLHLCGTNSRKDELLATAIPLPDVNDFINMKPVGQVVVILDCCFSGAAALGLKGDLPSLITNDIGHGQGKYVITSSSAIQVSRAVAGQRYSLFTKWLIAGLESDEPDADENGAITVEELFRYAKARTIQEEPGQEPQSATYEIQPGNVIIAYSDRAKRRPSTPTLASTHPVFFNAIQPLISDSRIVPFMGVGIFGSGPLSAFRLSTALSERGGLVGDADVATAAEYLYQLLEDRQLFLQAFRGILQRQSAEVQRNATYDLIMAVRRPPLVISATYDLLLEQRLEAEAVRYTLVAHILRSRDGIHDGKILVVRRNASPTVEICRADQFLLPPDELVIYKVLGSPFLDKYASPADAIDAVVVTESDHLTFLGRLENEHTRVPDAFSIPFVNSRLLFLGYSLDLWHYRLVLRVFGQGRSHLKKAYAVRQPTSQMEDLYWQRLHCDMIKADPNQFAEQLVTGLVAPVEEAVV